MLLLYTMLFVMMVMLGALGHLTEALKESRSQQIALCLWFWVSVFVCESACASPVLKHVDGARRHIEEGPHLLKICLLLCNVCKLFSSINAFVL